MMMKRQQTKKKIKQSKINRDRARRAAICMEAAKGGYEMGPGIDAGISDLINDLHHLCDTHGLSFDELCHRAAYHYEAERHPDDLERDLRRQYRMGKITILKD